MARKLKRDLTVEEQLARGPMDLPFLMLVLLLTGIGLIMMFSASYAYALYTRTDHDATYYFLRQGLFGAAGVAAMYVMSKVNYQSLRWMSVFALGASIVLLILVKVPGIGTTANGANRWIRAFGPIPQWQPSEAAKLGVILYFSARLAKRNTEKKKKFDRHQLKGRVLDLLDRIGFLELVPYGVVLVVIAGLLLLEPHMSATILILAIGASILFAAGIRLGWFAAGGAIAAVGLFFIINMTPYMNDRIAIWQNPWSDMRGDGYQTIQSLYAAGAAERFRILHRLRRAGLYRSGSGAHLVCTAYHSGLLAGHPCQGPVRGPAHRGCYHTGGGPGVFEHRRGYQSLSRHRHLSAVFQLRGHGPADPAAGDGHRAERVKTNPGPQGRLEKVFP